MDSVRSLAGVTGSVAVQDRNAGGNKRDAEAFQKALRQEGGAEKPVRTELQRRPPSGRKNDGIAHHVDVVA
jgi:hypothetical protein